MAIIKANYVKSSESGHAKIRNSARYYMRRTDRDGEKPERSAFSSNGDISREQAKEFLKNSEDNPYYYRMIMSPGSDETDESDLQGWTRAVMAKAQELQNDRIHWIAVEHGAENGHTDHPHVHVIVATQNKFDREQLETLREMATREWSEQQELFKEISRDQFHDNEKSNQIEIDRSLTI